MLLNLSLRQNAWSGSIRNVYIVRFISLPLKNRVCFSPCHKKPTQRRLPTPIARRMASNQPGHNVPSSSVISSVPEEPDIIAFQEHQATASRPSLADEARTLVADNGIGVLSSLSRDPEGFPFGSVVEYAADSTGRPIFAMSSLSPHTGDVRSDGRCSLTVKAAGFASLADARFTLTGRVTPLPEPNIPTARGIYMKLHPDSYWVDFGDFSWFKMDDIVQGRLVGGFGRIGKISKDEYLNATPDPVAKFSVTVAGHMNADHAEATVAMISHYIGIHVDAATILSIDCLGMNVRCERAGETFKCRLPFTSPALDRKSIKDRIVEMTKASQKSN